MRSNKDPGKRRIPFVYVTLSRAKRVSLCTVTSCTFSRGGGLRWAHSVHEYSTVVLARLPEFRGRSKSLGPLIISPAQLSGQLLRSLALEDPPALSLSLFLSLCLFFSAGTYVARNRVLRLYVYMCVFIRFSDAGT